MTDVQYIFSPVWFYGFDALFEAFSVVVCFLIAYYARKFFSVSGEKKHKYFSTIFFVIGFAFLVKILISLVLYYDLLGVLHAGTEVEMVKHQYTPVVADAIRSLGLFIARFLLISAFASLYAINYGEESKRFIPLLVYFAFITTFFSYGVFYVFHLTMAVLLFLLARYYYDNYKRRTVQSARIVALSFGMLFLSQLLFLLTITRLEMYVAGEFVQLVGFSLLLYDFITVK